VKVLMGESELDDFAAFYRRTYAAAYRTALGVTSQRALAEDVTQEAYCSAYRRRAGFRGGAPAEIWLQRIVVNEAIDQLRRRRARPTLEMDSELAITDGRDEPGRTAERMALVAAVTDLNPRQRAAIVLRYFHDYPMRTVGDVLGTSEGGAAMLVQRALAVLRQVVGEDAITRQTESEARLPKEAHRER
jgi:RNA polymerase sigma-70 factor, ECF subfamily